MTPPAVFGLSVLMSFVAFGYTKSLGPYDITAYAAQ